MKKSKEPCRHWAIDIIGRFCNDCDQYFHRPVDKDADTQADRDAHNALVIEKYQTGLFDNTGDL